MKAVGGILYILTSTMLLVILREIFFKNRSDVG